MLIAGISVGFRPDASQLDGGAAARFARLEGARRHGLGCRVGPAIPRRGYPKLCQTEIQHGTRRRTDIFPQLRLSQDDCG